MNLTRTSWPKGWNPSQDRNGDPQSLLRMDNLHIDEEGCISLVRGFKQLGGDFPDFISDLYSRTIGGQEFIYIGLNQGRQVLRSNVNFTGSQALVIDSGGTRPCFGSSLGQVYCSSGLKRKKDRGPSNDIRDLGLTTPTEAPQVTGISQAIKIMSNSWSLIEGDHLDGQQLYVDEDTLRGIMEAAQGGDNTLTIGSSNASDDPSKDRFYILIQLENSEEFKKIRVEIYMDDDNFYWKEWDVNADNFAIGLAQQTQLGCTRDEFIRTGSDASKNWSSISKIRIIGEAIKSNAWFLANEARFLGGATGQLNGFYQYCYVNVADNGIYQAKSGRSPISNPVLIFNGSATVNLQSGDDQTTEQWIYRRSLKSSEFRRNIDGTPSDDILVPLLDDFYLVEKRGGNNAFEEISDQAALQLNIRLNEFLQSVKDIEEPFVGIVDELYGERQLYLSRSYIYLSDRQNPDAVDTRFTQRAGGDPSEFNLWLKIVSNNLLILATTKDLYEVSGTFLDQPDGTIDINIRPIGEEYPPICSDAVAHSLNGVGSIFYIAADGWRVTTGSNSALISPQLTKLFQGENRYGVPPIAIYPGDVARYAITVGRNKLFCVSQHTDGSRRLFIYDLIFKYWRLQYTDPIYVHATETDKIYVGYGDTGSGFNIFEMEFGDDATVDFDEEDHGQGFQFETVLDHNGQPRNRKDTFTLKLNMDTGGEDVSIFLAKNELNEDSDWIHLGDYNSDGQGTIYISLDAAAVTLGFRYALKITNTNISGLLRFKLYEYTIEYDARPEQVNFLRIPNTNLGSYARKRITAFAFVIDTLGNNITFTPVLDGVSVTTSTFTRDGKLTYIHFFTEETIAVDIGGILSGGVFEYYDLNLIETVSEKLPTPTKYLVIPPNDYGNPNRKRHTSYKFSIRTRGYNVQFTPRIDGTSYPTSIVNTTEKRTHEHYFALTLDAAGVDIGGTLESLDNEDFEFYGTIIPQDLEILPPKLKSFYIPTTDYGIPNRKRHTSYKFHIDTQGQDVEFTPIVDGVEFAPSVANTTIQNLLHEHFFDTSLDVKGRNISGYLRSLSDNFFEFYKTINPQTVEVLPDRLKSLFTPATNFGHAAKKRIRTIPFVIDTGGVNVNFYPIVDGVQLDPSVHNTTRKQTVYHYFVTDVFGTDYSGYIQGTEPFEFYGFETPEDVELLPVPKKYDQLTPLRFDKIGKLFEIRIRIIGTGSTTSLPYTLYSDENFIHTTYGVDNKYSSTLTIIPNIDNVYTIQLPKSINGTIFRLVLGPSSDPFHRYDAQFRVTTSGMESEPKWITIR